MERHSAQRFSDRQRHHHIRRHRQRAQHMHAITKLSQEAEQLADNHNIIHYPAFGSLPRAEANTETELAEIRQAVHDAQQKTDTQPAAEAPPQREREDASDRIKALIEAEVKVALEEMAPQIISQTLISLLSRKDEKPKASDDG